jgi:pSer/pThr/pTyr-binding forkhead associated (FHA) protein
MNYKFVLIDRETGDGVRSWVLEPPVTVGRGMLCNLSLQDGSISRRHCEFVVNADGELVVRDLGSKNGIYLDGQMIDKAVIPPGTEVQIGLARVRVELTEQAVQAPGSSDHPKGHQVEETQAVRIFPPEEDRYEIG